MEIVASLTLIVRREALGIPSEYLEIVHEQIQTLLA
jgi:hypothetical protein